MMSTQEILNQITKVREELDKAKTKDQKEILQDTIDRLYEDLKLANQQSESNSYSGNIQINS